jgi:hypothetical protein
MGYQCRLLGISVQVAFVESFSLISNLISNVGQGQHLLGVPRVTSQAVLLLVLLVHCSTGSDREGRSPQIIEDRRIPMQDTCPRVTPSQEPVIF